MLGDSFEHESAGARRCEAGIARREFGNDEVGVQEWRCVCLAACTAGGHAKNEERN